jgi:arylamine N-acetyltransferase
MKILATLALVFVSLTGPTRPDAQATTVHNSPIVLVQQVGPYSLNQYVVILRNGNEWITGRCVSNGTDQRNCWWNAQTRGNHLGHSFALLGGRMHYTATNVHIYR